MPLLWIEIQVVLICLYVLVVTYGVLPVYVCTLIELKI